MEIDSANFGSHNMYGSRQNYATTHNPRRNESEFMHRERTPEPRCRQEQRTAGSSDPLIVLVQGLLDRLDHRTGESSEQRPSSPPDYLKMVMLMKKFRTVDILEEQIPSKRQDG